MTEKWDSPEQAWRTIHVDKPAPLIAWGALLALALSIGSVLALAAMFTPAIPVAGP